MKRQPPVVAYMSRNGIVCPKLVWDDAGEDYRKEFFIPLCVRETNSDELFVLWDAESRSYTLSQGDENPRFWNPPR
jgi:hypothetical protein